MVCGCNNIISFHSTNPSDPIIGVWNVNDSIGGVRQTYVYSFYANGSYELYLNNTLINTGEWTNTKGFNYTLSEYHGSREVLLSENKTQLLVAGYGGVLFNKQSSNMTMDKSTSPSPEVNVMQIVGTWNGENNLTYTFFNNSNVTVLDDATAANDYYHHTIGYGGWHYIGDYVVNIGQVSGGNNNTNYSKIFGSLGAFSISNDSGRLYFYDYRTPSIKYYKATIS